MPDYFQHALQKLQHIMKIYPKYSPHHYNVTKWTQKGDQQFFCKIDDSPFLTPKQNLLYIQIAVGTFLYYARTLDNAMLPALNDIAL